MSADSKCRIQDKQCFWSVKSIRRGEEHNWRRLGLLVAQVHKAWNPRRLDNKHMHRKYQNWLISCSPSHNQLAHWHRERKKRVLETTHQSCRRMALARRSHKTTWEWSTNTCRIWRPNSAMSDRRRCYGDSKLHETEEMCCSEDFAVVWKEGSSHMRVLTKVLVNPCSSVPRWGRTKKFRQPDQEAVASLGIWAPKELPPSLLAL